MKRLMFFAALVVASIGLAGSASASSQGPIDFESYNTGNIDGQHGWSKTGGYDVAVVNVVDFPAASGYGFGAKALRSSDSVTSGSFGDQTFSPGLTDAAGEAGLSHFTATFRIGTTSAAVQPGLHMSVSPDDGNGGRMSYLRFEDQADGVHVFFDDATDAGPVGTVADFSDSDIATLNRTSAHTVTFGIGFRTDAADLVNIYVDGSLKHSGTTWENYYRYDPEQDGNSHAIPNTSKLLFREGGAANSGNAGGGFLVDGVSLTSSTCTPTTFSRDGHFLTAAQIGGPVSGTLEATGCDIGVYYEPGSGPTEAVSSGDISGAKYFGVLVNGATVDVTNSSVHSIGDVPLNGSQHGNAIVYLNGAHGTISGNHVFNYQKNGITVSGVDDNGTVRPNPTTSASVLNNVVTGEGHVSYIAQNGIQISFGASGLVRGNTVSRNWYTPAGTEACGLLLYQANGVKQQMNNLFDNEVNFCNFGRGGGHVSPQA